jgi:hypothetical protein
MEEKMTPESFLATAAAVGDPTRFRMLVRLAGRFRLSSLVPPWM